ncbi:MFS transporter [Streptomyces sp. NPDC033538]|uniref:MFS transporter n=1 Tax=Streptomyces sp. NPDC033538 TaxID=3155367 RepID=UPI00340F99D6
MRARTGTASYRSVLRTPGAAAFFLVAAPARVGVAMAGLGIVWLVHTETGSFGAAGLVTGSFAVAETLVGPQTARLMDRFGQPRVLIPLLGAHAGAIAALVALARTGTPVVALMAAGLAAGATIPQFGALAAARWSALLHGRAQLAPALALETVSNEVAFLLGPALAVLTATQLHPAAGTVLAGALVVGAGLAFAALRRTAPAPVAPPAADCGDARAPGTLWTRNFATLLAVNLALGVFFGSMQVSVSAFAHVHHAAAAAGFLYGLLSAASLLAGLVYGRYRRNTTPAAQLPLILTALACASLLPLLADTPWQLGLALLLPGAGVAPCIIVSSMLTESVMDRTVLTQAFTWTNSASAAGIALSAAAVGRLVDGSGGPQAGFTVPLLFLTAAAVLTWSSRHGLTTDNQVPDTRPVADPRWSVAVRKKGEVLASRDGASMVSTTAARPSNPVCTTSPCAAGSARRRPTPTSGTACSHRGGIL